MDMLRTQFNRLFLLSMGLFWLCFIHTGCQSGTVVEIKPVDDEETISSGIEGTENPVLPSIISPIPSTATVRPTMTSPVATGEPATVVTITSIPSPWQLDMFDSFLLYGANKAIYFFQPGNVSTFIADGYLLGGQPWSPDGKEFVFNSDLNYRLDPHNQLAVANLSTGQTRLISLLGQPESVFWSPDGKYLLYEVPVAELIEGASYVDTKFQARIALYDFASQQNVLLTETSNILTLAGWSPDSQRIAFISTINDQDAQVENDLYTFGQFDLSILDIESLALQQITNSPDIELLAAWSPTDELLLLGATPINDSWPNREFILEFSPWVANNLYLIDTSGTTLANLSGSTSVAWSADGKKIAYAGKPLCVLELETLSSNCLPANNFTIRDIGEFPSWSADNRWLAVRVQDPEKNIQCYTIYILDMVKNIESRIDLEHCFYGPIYWSR
jgi:Tol biopolymer transport system component